MKALWKENAIKTLEVLRLKKKKYENICDYKYF